MRVSASTWEAPVLEGRSVRLEPLERRHADGLWEASRDPRTWAWLSIAQPATRAELDAFLDAALAASDAGTEIPLVTMSRPGLVGSTRFLALRPEHGSVEIGWTWLHPSVWGTGVNVEAKLLMLRHAFETWGCRTGRAEDRRAQRALPRRDGGDGRDLRGRAPKAHARPRRGEPRLRLVQRHGRRLARVRDGLVARLETTTAA